MGIMGSLIPVQWTNGYCCIPQSFNKIKKLIDWVSKPSSGRKFLFCDYIIAHTNTMDMI
jgi:hypothetical protein